MTRRKNMQPQEHTFESITVGQVIEPYAFSISEADMDTFAGLSGDTNQLHTDEDFAKDKGFNGRVVYGMLLASKLSYLVGMLLPGRDSVYMGQDIIFRNPVYIDEQCTLQAKVLSKSESTRIIEIEITIIKHSGEIALEGTAKVKLT